MLAKFERMETAAMAEHDQLLSRGDIEGADAVITALPTWSPEKKAAFNQKARKKHEMNVLDAQVTNDPWAEPDYPEWVTPAERTRMERKRVANQNAYMSEELADITKDIQAGNLFDKDQIKERLDQSPIMAEASERDRQIFYQNAKKNLPLDRAEIASHRQMIQSLATIENDPTITQEVYEESFAKQQFEIAKLAGRPGSERLAQELEEYSLDAREERRRDGDKRHIFHQKTAAFNQMAKARLSITDEEKLSRQTKLDNWIQDRVQEEIDHVGPKAIREFDENREKNSDSWVQRKIKEYRGEASKEVDMAPLLDALWADEPNPLLPPKPNALGEQ